MKIRLVGNELLHADEWTDGRTDRHDRRDEGNSRFSQFRERPQNPQEHAISKSGAVVPPTLAPEIDYFAHSYYIVQLVQFKWRQLLTQQLNTYV